MTKIPLECYLEFDFDQWRVSIHLHDGKEVLVGKTNDDIALFYEMKAYDDAELDRIEEYGKEKLAWI